MSVDLDRLCRPTEFLDYHAPVMRDFVSKALGDDGGAVGRGDGGEVGRGDGEHRRIDRAIRLYYAVRDRIDYEVYGADLSRPGMRASAVIGRGSGFCVHKSLVYAAALRSVGIPSRLVFADVRNHLASPRLTELMGGDLFRFHCLTSVHLGGRWVRATPVFNKTLCRLYRMTPLEFDGVADSVYHPFDEDGRRHMEFVREHGEFDDFPYDLVVDGIRAAHPRFFASQHRTAQGSLAAEASS